MRARSRLGVLGTALILLASACAAPALRTSDPADDPSASGLPSTTQTPSSSGSSAPPAPPTSDFADPQDAHHAPPATTATTSAAETAATAPLPAAYTDAQILRELQRTIANDAALSTGIHRVNVSCRDGRVVLSGSVPTLTARTSIENAARHIGGVRQIDSRIVIEK